MLNPKFWKITLYYCVIDVDLGPLVVVVYFVSYIYTKETLPFKSFGVVY